MLIPLVSVAVMLLIIGIVVLVLIGGYRLCDLLVLGFLTFVTLYLSRLDLLLITTIGGRPFVTFHWLLLGTAIVLGFARLLFKQSPRLGYAPIFGLVGLFILLGLTSGLVNGGTEGFAAAVQVMVIALLPLIVAALWVDLVPRMAVHSRRLRLGLILLGGVLTPFLLVSSAIAPNLYGALLGWSAVTAERTAGFVRGWSPLGSPISTGMIMVLAYGFAMHEVIAHRKRIYCVVLLAVVVAALFTLSRSVVLMLLIFQLIYSWSVVRRHAVATFAIGIAGVIVLVPVLWVLQERYSFERLIRVSDASIEIRGSSAVAALRTSAENPLLGQGPGLIYEELRTDWVTGERRLRHQTVVRGEVSAMEPHNVFLLLAAEHGWLAMIVFAAILVSLWRRVRISKWLVNEADRSASLMFNALWLSSLAMLLTYSGPLVNPQASVLFWFFAFSGLHWRETALRQQASSSVGFEV